MKFGWQKEESAPLLCKVVVAGVARELSLRHLTALDVDQADRAYPAPELPAGEVERPAAEESRAMGRLSFVAVLALGPDVFNATDTESRLAELQGTFTKTAIIEIAHAAMTDSRLTAAHLEAAKAAVNPPASAG